ncbi:MAG TPA: roadblock/LC7 domain-containing protein [Longimicrobiales bacterium]|nr:roadblock/LC7 domain-containing protein [Longimicrobiales bacterium]
MTLSSGNIGLLGSDDVRAFEELLTGFVTDTRAATVLLVDRAGRMLASAGDVGELDGTTFASLAAAGFSASSQLAVLLGEDEFSSLYHHGLNRSMFLADVAGTAVLAVLFDGRTTLGMVRIRSKLLVPALAQRFARLAADGPSGQVTHMAAEWAEEAESEIDRLFNG